MIDILGDAATAAPALLGYLLVRRTRGAARIGTIVETEAYLPDDPACHAYAGPTTRNETMFGPAGRAYVYRIHRSHCLNVVTGPSGSGQAVLIRAIEPRDGLDSMRRARRIATVGASAPRGTTLTNGPGKLCQAMGIDLRFDGADLLERRAASARSGLYLLPRDRPPPPITRSVRIGISKARERQLRFFVTDNLWVSRANPDYDGPG